MKALVLTAAHAAAYRDWQGRFIAGLEERLAARRALRPDRQRAARKGAETKRRAGA